MFAADDGFGGDASIADIGAPAVSAVDLAPPGVGTPANSFEIYARDINAPIFCKPGDSGSLIVNEQDLWGARSLPSL